MNSVKIGDNPFSCGRDVVHVCWMSTLLFQTSGGSVRVESPVIIRYLYLDTGCSLD
jgi:hypothetical protein